MVGKKDVVLANPRIDKENDHNAVVEAGRHVPSGMRGFLYAGYFVLLAGAAVLATRFPIGDLVSVGFALIGFSVLAGLLYIATAAQEKSGFLAKLFLWLVVGTFTIVCWLLVSAMLFGWPPQAATLIARLLNAQELIVGSDETVTWKPGLDLSPFAPVPSRFVDPFDRVLELKQKPALKFTGRIVLADLNTDGLAASRVEFNNAVVILGLKTLKIETVDFNFANSSVVAFEDRAAPEAPSAPGQQGVAGKSAGTLNFTVHGNVSGLSLPIDLDGTPGGPGAPGLAGPSGAKGASGDNSASGGFDCKHGPGRGRPGQPGGPGGDGGAGGNGGNGGTVVLDGKAANALSALIKVSINGGRGGPGGGGGRGGQGGPGGDGGGSSGWCSGRGPTGAAGALGPAGRAGHPGQPGNAGQLSIVSASQS